MSLLDLNKEITNQFLEDNGWISICNSSQYPVVEGWGTIYWHKNISWSPTPIHASYTYQLIYEPIRKEITFFSYQGPLKYLMKVSDAADVEAYINVVKTTYLKESLDMVMDIYRA